MRMNEAKVLLSIGFILLLGLLQIAFNAKRADGSGNFRWCLYLPYSWSSECLYGMKMFRKHRTSAHLRIS